MPDARAAGTMNVRIVVSAQTCRKPIESRRSIPGVRRTPRTSMTFLPGTAACGAPAGDARPNEIAVTAVSAPLAASARPMPPTAARPGSMNDATRPPAATDICRIPRAVPRRSAGNPWNTEIVPATWISEPAMPESSRQIARAATPGL